MFYRTFCMVQKILEVAIEKGVGNFMYAGLIVSQISHTDLKHLSKRKFFNSEKRYNLKWWGFWRKFICCKITPKYRPKIWRSDGIGVVS